MPPSPPPKCHWRPDEVRKAEGRRALSTITTPIEETNRNKDNMSHETLHWKPQKATLHEQLEVKI